jgi:rhamnosyltransferase
MSLVSVIVRCHNEERHIGRLFEGIAQQSLRDVEMIVVDSGSTDRTLEIARRFPTKIVKIRPEEFSFGRSLNVGCAAANGEFLVLASAHVYPVYCEWLERLIAPFADPQVALSYGKQRGNEVTRFSEHQVFARWFPDESNPRQTHSFCNNANAAIRRTLWESMPYDEELTGLEDLDWAKRAIQAGHVLAYAADAEVVHVHEESPRRIFNRYRREAIALRRIFPEEHVHFGDLLRLFTGNVAADLRHARHDGALRAHAIDILMFRAMQFWGTYRGFNHWGPVASDLKHIFYYPNHSRPNPGQAPRAQYREIKYSPSRARVDQRD